MNKEEIIKLFMAAGYVLTDELVSQLTGKLKLLFAQDGFVAEIWVKGQPVEDVVKVIATYEYMRGANVNESKPADNICSCGSKNYGYGFANGSGFAQCFDCGKIKGGM